MIDDLKTKVLEMFNSILGSENVSVFDDNVYLYGQDGTMNLNFAFDFLLFPQNPQEISGIMKICNQFGIPLVARGGGTGVAGGALPVNGGVVVSLEKMNKILQINTVDAYVICEPGVISQSLSSAISKAGFFFPVFPSSKHFSTIGGNVATNAGSIYSCKYGKTNQYVLNLEVVLPTGEIIWTGFNVKKNSTGFNLTNLFVGGEGVLGIITKIVYRVIPISVAAHKAVLLGEFDSLKCATEFMIEVNYSNIVPAALELIGFNALKITSDYLKLPLDRSNRDAVQIIIELHDTNPLAITDAVKRLTVILASHSKKEFKVGFSAEEIESLWELRLMIGNALTEKNKFYRDIDAAVPLGKLHDYLKNAERVASMYGIEIAFFGHALDGNPHVMLLCNDVAISNTFEFKSAVAEIYSYAMCVGGVISGEHGVGFLNKTFMSDQLASDNLIIMKKIKGLFDPFNVLNPGKLWN
jgi:glycolate oxidase